MLANLRYWVLALLLITLFGFVQACAGSDASQFNSGTSISGASVIAPDFTAMDVVTGQNITLSDYQGSAVLLNFVNYGCSSSINNIVSQQLLDIRELHNQRSDFLPVSVFCGCCSEEVLRDFTEDNDLIWPCVLDTDYSIIDKYEDYLKMYGYPTLVYIVQEHNIREVGGYLGQNSLADKLDQILKEK